MAIGNNLKVLRTKKGMTQKALADELHVTYQAVSRWENDDVEPSIDTLRSLTKVLECSLDDLFGNDIQEQDTAKGPAEPIVVERVVEVASKPVLALCEECNQPIFDSEDICRYNTYHSLGGRGNRTETVGHILCKECNRKRLEAEAEKAKQQQRDAKRRCRNRRIRSFIYPSLIAAVIITAGISGHVGDASMVTGSIILGALSFFFAACLILGNNFVGDMWIDVASWGFVRMPGIIFSLDLEGLIWLITVKLALWILGLVLAVAAAIFATLLALVVSVFVYPFALVKNFRGIENN